MQRIGNFGAEVPETLEVGSNSRAGAANRGQITSESLARLIPWPGVDPNLAVAITGA